MNSGGVRADLKQGKVSWGELFAIQPFGNKLMVKQYTGKQLIALLEKGHHWSDGVSKNNQGNWLVNQRLIEPTKLYRVGGNNYVMNTSPFDQGELVFTGESDIDATVNYIRQLPAPFSLDDKPQ
jgi:5'-nucleotidase